MSDEREENRRRKRGKMWPTEVAFEDLPHHLQIHSLERNLERLGKRIAVAVIELDVMARSRCAFCSASNQVSLDDEGYWHRGYDRSAIEEEGHWPPGVRIVDDHIRYTCGAHKIRVVLAQLEGE